MNIEKLKEELIADEGVVNEIYLDHLGYPTFGIGHLILATDPEHGMPIGTNVSDDRVHESFVSDISSVLLECKNLYGHFETLPEECQLIIANMMFNMGKPRLSKFKKMKAAIEDQNYIEAAAEMKDSKWYRQVPNRAERLVQRMLSLAV